MTEKRPSSISIPDQILEALFLGLENQDGFNNDLIEQLRELAKRDELNKLEKVSNVLKIYRRG
jgi:O-phosphoseryl-tRNA(Cys) synthetase